MLISFNPKLQTFAEYLAKECPRHFMVLALIQDYPSEEGDETLSSMLDNGILYWKHLENIMANLPGLN